MFKPMHAALIGVVCSVFLARAVSTQEAATLVLQSGERLQGDLIDMNASGLAIRVNGQNRQVSVDQVASIDFTPGDAPADVQTRVSQGQPVVVLRNGQTLDGRLSDIGGTHPLRLTVDTSSGRRDFTSNEVAHIVMRAMPGAASARAADRAAPASPPSSAAANVAVPPGAIRVPANQAWTDSGLTVRRGDTLTFNATGDIMISATASSGPGGSPAATVPRIRYPVTDAPVGALIGRIGNGRPFLITNQTMSMPADGPLMLGINDDHVQDNSGAFIVSITDNRGDRANRRGRRDRSDSNDRYNPDDRRYPDDRNNPNDRNDPNDGSGSRRQRPDR